MLLLSAFSIPGDLQPKKLSVDSAVSGPVDIKVRRHFLQLKDCWLAALIAHLLVCSQPIEQGQADRDGTHQPHLMNIDNGSNLPDSAEFISVTTAL